MLQASELFRLNISTKSWAQKLFKQSASHALPKEVCDYGISYKRCRTYLRLLSVFENQLSRFVIYWVQRNLSPTASLQFHASRL